jgi:hypothetical protein
MPVVTVELNATKEYAEQPLVWRLGKLFHVVTNLRRARITEDYAYLALDIEGSNPAVTEATGYLHALGLIPQGETTFALPAGPLPDTEMPRPSAITVQIRTVNAAQAHAPILYRIGKDYTVVVNIERAALDEEEGGMVEITISGLLADVQRAIAYLHTTGLLINPLQRSVSDRSNL